MNPGLATYSRVCTRLNFRSGSHAKRMPFAYNRSMPALQIRDFPVALHRMLIERARLERRTIAQQATVLLAEALTAAQSPKERRSAVLAGIVTSRRRFDFKRITPPEKLIRADRNR
jgi:hypothetical protein